MEDAIRKADTLIEAMSWIRQFRDKTTVIKLGGSVLESEDSFLKSGVFERQGDALSMLKNNIKAVILWEKALELNKGSASLKKKIKKGQYVE